MEESSVNIDKQHGIVRPKVMETLKAPVKFELFTPEEGCGLSKAAHNRIVNGVVSKNGMLD